MCLVGATGLGCVLASIEFSKAMTAWAFYVVTVLGLILRLLSA